MLHSHRVCDMDANGEGAGITECFPARVEMARIVREHKLAPNLIATETEPLSWRNRPYASPWQFRARQDFSSFRYNNPRDATNASFRTVLEFERCVVPFRDVAGEHAIKLETNFDWIGYPLLSVGWH